MFKMATTL